MNSKQYDVICLGGGLAGLTAAIHLAKDGFNVLVIEKNKYPNHKVCGEYISNEAVPYLQHLGIDVYQKGAIPIKRFQLSTVSGKTLATDLPLGGFGLSRHCFDNTLFIRAQELGVQFCFDTVENTVFDSGMFITRTKTKLNFESRVVLGSFGKRSILDKSLKRKTSKEKSSWMAVKDHYEFSEFPSDLVGLHNFNGGYGGLSKTESGAINFCYLVKIEAFKKHGTIDDFNEKIVKQNPYLRDFLQNAKPIFKKPLSIAQVSFALKLPVENHLLMIGDSAGLIHPLCGNGMAMAIHSAKLAAQEISVFLKGKIDRVGLEKNYARAWKQSFSRRLWAGRRIQSILLNEASSYMAMNTIAGSKKIVRSIIRQTHGKPILV